MSDLIDRQLAIDVFDDYNVSVENGELEAYSRDRKRLCELPPAQSEPCDFCRWNPPSSGDGKPCSMCPAKRRTDEGD